jgi:hypothetical protein
MVVVVVHIILVQLVMQAAVVHSGHTYRPREVTELTDIINTTAAFLELGQAEI